MDSVKGPTVDALRELGLTRYEAEAYFTLFLHRRLTADELSMFSGISPSRVYDVLSALGRRGMLTVLNEKPKKYHAVEPEMALRSLVSEKEDELSRRLGRIKSMETLALESLRKAPRAAKLNTDLFVGHTTSSSASERFLRGAFRDARREVLFFAGNLSWFAGHIGQFKALRQRGVRVRVLCDVNGRSRRHMDEAAKHRIEIRRKSKSIDLRGFVFDGKMVFISHAYKLDGDGARRNNSHREYSALVAQSRPLARSLREYFYTFWGSPEASLKKSVPV